MKNQILLVDDEEDIREVLHLSLSDMGYEVVEAENGVEALRIFRETQPPIVLTDIKMPKMDGIELLQKIKLENRETEVIMITGHGDMDLAIKSLKYKAADFITKPINVEGMEVALRRTKEKIIIRQRLRAYTENLEKLLREKTELQDHLSSLGLMISSIAHGIKGLITGLDGGMYILNSGLKKKDYDKIENGWKVIKHMTERIRKMVLDILFYAKERDLKWRRIDVLSFAHEVAMVVEEKMKDLDIEFVKDFDSKVGILEVDSGYVHSALINILENAADACINDQSKKDHKITFRVKDENDQIVFEVLDNGTGMDVETKEKIFTPFFSSKGDQGTGLGLFIAHKIVEQHGGEIKVKSNLRQGTAFRIIIPKLQPESAQVPESAVVTG